MLILSRASNKYYKIPDQSPERLSTWGHVHKYKSIRTLHCKNGVLASYTIDMSSTKRKKENRTN